MYRNNYDYDDDYYSPSKKPMPKGKKWLIGILTTLLAIGCVGGITYGVMANLPKEKTPPVEQTTPPVVEDTVTPDKPVEPEAPVVPEVEVQSLPVSLSLTTADGTNESYQLDFGNLDFLNDTHDNIMCSCSLSKLPSIGAYNCCSIRGVFLTKTNQNMDVYFNGVEAVGASSDSHSSFNSLVFNKLFSCKEYYLMCEVDFERDTGIWSYDITLVNDTSLFDRNLSEYTTVECDSLTADLKIIPRVTDTK